jgi:hypothetical protein
LLLRRTLVASVFKGLAMNERGFITATMHELERIKIIEAVCEHRLTMVLAAERLGLCERQISRLARRYASSGPAGLISGKRGQPSNRELPVDLRARSMALVRERYADFGPTLACENVTALRWRRKPYGAGCAMRVCGSRASSGHRNCISRETGARVWAS